MSTRLEYAKYITNVVNFQEYILQNYPSVTISSIENTSSAPTNINSSVVVNFNGILDTNDISSINGFVRAYANPTITRISKVDTVSFTKRIFTNTEYELITEFVYNGSRELTEFSKILINSIKEDTSAYTYSIRVWDVTNIQLITEVTGINNSTLQIQSFTNLSNIPPSIAILEFHIKIDTPNTLGVDVNSIQLIYT